MKMKAKILIKKILTYIKMETPSLCLKCYNHPCICNKKL